MPKNPKCPLGNGFPHYSKYFIYEAIRLISSINICTIPRRVVDFPKKFIQVYYLHALNAGNHSTATLLVWFLNQGLYRQVFVSVKIVRWQKRELLLAAERNLIIWIHQNCN